MNRSPKSIVNETREIPGFRTVLITDLESGLPYEASSTLEDFMPELAAAYSAQIIKAKLRANKLDKSTQKITKITTTSSNETHIISIAPNNKYFIDLTFSNTEFNGNQVMSLIDKFESLGDLDSELLNVQKEAMNEKGKIDTEALFKNFFFSEFGDPGTA